MEVTDLARVTRVARRVRAGVPLGKVLVTGGAGFLGRFVSEAMAKAGWQVTVLDDLSSQSSTFDCASLRHPSIRTIEGSVLDAEVIGPLVAEHPVVVHFASIVGVEETISKPVATSRNLVGTLNITEALTPEHTVLFSSSADVYGMHSQIHDHGMREDDRVVFEHAGVNRWVYPKVKALEENLLLHSGAAAAIIRVFNSYGAEMDVPQARRVIPNFIARILAGQPLQISGDGQQKRSFCYFVDTLEGVMLALEAAVKHGPGYRETFNIGHPHPMTITELAHVLMGLALELGIVREPLPIEHEHNAMYTQSFDDTWSRVPDIGRAKARLGFAPQVPLGVGLRMALQTSRLRAEGLEA